MSPGRPRRGEGVHGYQKQGVASEVGRWVEIPQVSQLAPHPLHTLH